MSITVRMSAIAVAAALTLGACGDDDDNQDQAYDTNGQETTTATTTGGDDVQVDQPVVVDGVEANFEGARKVSGELDFELDTNYFEPTVLVGEPGETVTLNASNHADIGHTFTLREQDIDIVFQPGDEQTIEVTIPDSGEVGFICRFHEEQGMVGQLRAQ